MKKKRHNPKATLGAILLVISLFLSFQKPYSGSNEALQFILAALPWVIAGLGLALVCAGYASEKKK